MHPHPPDLLKKIVRKPRFLLILPALAWLVFDGAITGRSLRLGASFLIAGEALRIWANGYVGHLKVNRSGLASGKIGRLITAGPYAFVRNPLYLGTFLLTAGFLFMGNRSWPAFVFLPPLIYAYYKKVLQEESLLAAECGDFRRYRSVVPRFLPGLRRYDRREGTWTRAGLAASKEWKTVLWLGVLSTLLYLREKVLIGHEPFAWHAAAAFFIFALISADAFLSRRLASERRRFPIDLRFRRVG